MKAIVFQCIFIKSVSSNNANSKAYIIEDDPDDQDFFVDALKRLHPAIVCDIAINGEEALKMIAASPPYDVIFMDLNMPVMDGCSCLSKLKSGKYKTIPVIILTTSTSPKDIERCKNLGAAMYCVKPDSYEALFKGLKTILTKGVNFPST